MAQPQTPSHTLDALKAAIANAAEEGPARERFIRIDARVLEWLISDSRALGGTEPDATPAGSVVDAMSGVTAGETATVSAMRPEQVKSISDSIIELLPNDPRMALSVLAITFATAVASTGCRDAEAYDALRISLAKMRDAHLSAA